MKLLHKSPLATKPSRFGWPYHGMIEGINYNDEGVLTLPSGRQITCTGARQNNTYLWDLGLPDEAGTDADQHWWGRAIIRGNVAYGGLKLNAYPVVIAGQKMAYSLSFQMQSGNQGVVMTLTCFYGGSSTVATATYSAGELGLKPDATDTITFTLCDYSPDGRKSLWVAREKPVLSPPKFWSSIIEIELSGSVLAPLYSKRVVSAWSAREVSNPGPTQAVQMAAWQHNDGPVVIQPAGDPTPPGMVPLDEFLVYSVGAASLRLERSFPVWAWYRGGDVDVIKLQGVETYEYEVADVNPVRALSTGRSVSTMRGEYSITCQSGTATLITSVHREDSLSQEDQKTTGTVTLTIDDQVRRTHVFDAGSISANWVAEIGSVPDSWIESGLSYAAQAYAGRGIVPLFYYDDGGQPAFDVAVRASNKIITPSVTYYGSVTGDLHDVFGPALTPTSFDDKTYDFRRDALNSNQLTLLRTGAYNPVTGEMVRQKTDKYRTWV